MSGPPKRQEEPAASSAFGWIDERFKIRALVEYLGHKAVPVHGHSVFYYLGGITLFLFLVQVATGILKVVEEHRSLLFDPHFLRGEDPRDT